MYTSQERYHKNGRLVKSVQLHKIHNQSEFTAIAQLRVDVLLTHAGRSIFSMAQ